VGLIAVDALLNGIPESIVIGVSMIGEAVGWVTVAAVFLSNVPEGLQRRWHEKQAVLATSLVWASIALASCGGASGYALFSHFSVEIIAATTAVQAISGNDNRHHDSRSLRASHELAGLITVFGFLAFVLSSSKRINETRTTT